MRVIQFSFLFFHCSRITAGLVGVSLTALNFTLRIIWGVRLCAMYVQQNESRNLMTCTFFDGTEPRMSRRTQC